MPLVHPAYKVAAVQAAPAFLDLEGAVAKTIKYIKEAAGNGAKLVAFPEVWIPGYPWWIWLETPAAAIKKGYINRYFDNALSYDSSEADQIRAAVKENDITVVLGLAERCGGSLYIAQWIIGPEGETIAQRRKIKPTHAERTAFGEGDGSHIAVHDTPLGKLGALNCWENILSLTKFAMFSQNEQVHVASWPSFTTYEFAHAISHEMALATNKVYAIEGGCFVIAPTAIVSEEMIELLCDTPEKHELIRAGGGHTVIFGPDGAPLAEKLGENEEGIMYADIDLSVISIAKNSMDACGHYARPDIARLLFNNKPGNRVEEFSPGKDVQFDESQFEETNVEA